MERASHMNMPDSIHSEPVRQDIPAPGLVPTSQVQNITGMASPVHSHQKARRISTSEQQSNDSMWDIKAKLNEEQTDFPRQLQHQRRAYNFQTVKIQQCIFVQWLRHAWCPGMCPVHLLQNTKALTVCIDQSCSAAESGNQYWPCGHVMCIRRVR